VSNLSSEVQAAIIKAASDWAIRMASIPPTGGLEVNQMGDELCKFFKSSYDEITAILELS